MEVGARPLWNHRNCVMKSWTEHLLWIRHHSKYSLLIYSVQQLLVKGRYCQTWHTCYPSYSVAVGRRIATLWRPKILSAPFSMLRNPGRKEGFSFWDRVSYNPGWSQAHCVVKVALVHHIQFMQYWGFQGSVNDRQALYQLHCIPSPELVSWKVVPKLERQTTVPKQWACQWRWTKGSTWQVRVQCLSLSRQESRFAGWSNELICVAREWKHRRKTLEQGCT